jgi:23S rRNA (guanosine2251-2'-O)-methyltransferase
VSPARGRSGGPGEGRSARRSSGGAGGQGQGHGRRRPSGGAKGRSGAGGAAPAGGAGKVRGGFGGHSAPPPTRVTGRGRPAAIPSWRRGRVSSGRGLGGDQVEGRQAVRELLLAGARRVRELWMVDEGDDAPILRDIRELAEANRVPLTVVGRGRFARQARSEAPQGVLALAAPLPEADLDDLVAGHHGVGGAGATAVPFLVALDGVTDPGNLGAILRSAECAGVTGVLLPRHRAVHVTPAATKAAAGAVEHLPIAVVGGLPAALARLRDAGVRVVGLDGQAPKSLHELEAGEGPVCLVLGAEGRGLSRLVRERCDELVAIPMHGRLGSLNVSAAAALACFEIARRR